MRKLAVGMFFALIISAQGSITFAAHPSVFISQSCSKMQIGKTKTVAKKTYVCVKNGKSGIWKLNAGGKALTTTTTSTIPNCLQSGPCVVGSKGPGGGIVFYDAGSVQPWGRFLEVAPTSWMSEQAGARPIFNQKLVQRHWGCLGTNIPTGTAIGTGRSNSIAMSSSCAENNPAGLVSTLSINGLNDWFVPSLDELKALMAQSGIFSPPNPGYSKDLYFGYTYWSSSQASVELSAQYLPQYAWSCESYTLRCGQGQKFSGGLSVGLGVIPIRAFS